MAGEKWTPGPWSIWTHTPGAIQICAIDGDEGVKAHRQCVGEVSATADGVGEHNARLIAVSPRLYAVLQSIVDSAVSTRDVIAVDEWLIQEAKNVLAEARGER